MENQNEFVNLPARRLSDLSISRRLKLKSDSELIIGSVDRPSFRVESMLYVDGSSIRWPLDWREGGKAKWKIVSLLVESGITERNLRWSLQGRAYKFAFATCCWSMHHVCYQAGPGLLYKASSSIPLFTIHERLACYCKLTAIHNRISVKHHKCSPNADPNENLRELLW